MARRRKPPKERKEWHNYICGIMTNWRDEGIESIEQLEEAIEIEKDQPSQKPDKTKTAEGMPNAGAYQENKDLIAQWRATMGDDYSGLETV